MVSRNTSTRKTRACCDGPEIERLRLTRCEHGGFHLYLGKQTLHLTARELLLIARGINRWVQHHPSVLSELDLDQWQELDRCIEHD